MDNKEKLEKIKEWEFKKSAYDLVIGTTYFDDETIAPPAGQEYRYDRLSYMVAESYKIKTDRTIKALLEELSKEDLDEVTDRHIALLYKGFKKLEAIPQDLYAQYTKVTLASTASWHEAKKKDDFTLFKPHLLKVIELKKKIAMLYDPQKDPYDVMLDEYEEGMTKADYDEFFALIKSEILPLIEKIKKAKPIRDDFIYRFYDKERQALLMTKLKEILNFDPSWGYMGVSMHPFTSGLSTDDVRITTFYDEHNIASAIYSIVHEVGHAFYEHQMDKNLEGTILRDVSSGMHESQSRLLENYIGRRESFIKNYFDFLKELYPAQLEDVDIVSFTRACNVAKPSLIRTDADELTYPIHILIRYEIEKGIFDGSIDLDHLEDVWNDYYMNYLGIRPRSAKEGILQDIHWSDGSFGYFPTYALGSALAAQIMKVVEEEIDIDRHLEDGDIKVITDYLKENIHRYGAIYDFKTITRIATHEDFDPHHYIDYLKDKYTKLYDLKGA